MIVLLMGVSGSGKTTIGELLAGRMHAVFADADSFHSAANKAKMASGRPLDDNDRQPWLERLNLLMGEWVRRQENGVLACSALKESYRKTLVHDLPKGSVLFVWLDGSKDLIAGRLAERKNHYMNPGLLDSQLATLEPPSDALRIVNDRRPEEVVNEIMQHVQNEEEQTDGKQAV
ncbi:MAG: gluconokinase [Acidobacteriaceae bacterium]